MPLNTRSIYIMSSDYSNCWPHSPPYTQTVRFNSAEQSPHKINSHQHQQSVPSTLQPTLDVQLFEYFALFVYTFEVLMRFSATDERAYFFVKGDYVQNLIDTGFVVIQLFDLIMNSVGDGLPASAMEVIMYLRVVRLIKVRDFIKVQAQETWESIKGMRNYLIVLALRYFFGFFDRGWVGRIFFYGLGEKLE